MLKGAPARAHPFTKVGLEPVPLWTACVLYIHYYKRVHTVNWRGAPLI